MSGMFGVFIGGVLALPGSWLGPWFSQRPKEVAKRRLRRIQKYEELISAIFEFDSCCGDELSWSRVFVCAAGIRSAPSYVRRQVGPAVP
jgi:hypothetical protein